MDQLFAATALDNVHGHGNVEQQQQQMDAAMQFVCVRETGAKGCRILHVETRKTNSVRKNMVRAQVRNSACSFSCHWNHSNTTTFQNTMLWCNHTLLAQQLYFIFDHAQWYFPATPLLQAHHHSSASLSLQQQQQQEQSSLCRNPVPPNATVTVEIVPRGYLQISFLQPIRECQRSKGISRSKHS